MIHHRFKGPNIITDISGTPTKFAAKYNVGHNSIVGIQFIPGLLFKSSFRVQV